MAARARVFARHELVDAIASHLDDARDIARFGGTSRLARRVATERGPSCLLWSLNRYRVGGRPGRRYPGTEHTGRYVDRVPDGHVRSFPTKRHLLAAMRAAMGTERFARAGDPTARAVELLLGVHVSCEPGPQADRTKRELQSWIELGAGSRAGGAVDRYLRLASTFGYYTLYALAHRLGALRLDPRAFE